MVLLVEPHHWEISQASHKNEQMMKLLSTAVEYKDLQKPRHASYRSSTMSGASRKTGKTLSDTFSPLIGAGCDAALSLLCGNSSLAPATRQSSLRSSGFVNSSKQSLVSLCDARKEEESEGNIEYTTADGMDEEQDNLNRSTSTQKQAGNLTISSPAVSVFGKKAEKGPMHPPSPPKGQSPLIDSSMRCISVGASATIAQQGANIVL
ncbi:hypothetical protein BDZ91DRAFT_52330 [Kalaharituber pfeilii]|nr:hypothetical protein BDZ91DRAFT_52330 [Kalaharituber pfeilii]